MTDWDDDDLPPARPSGQSARPSARAGTVDRKARLRRRARISGIVLALLVLIASPWWGRRALSHLSFFRLRKVEIEGLRYMPPADVAARMKVDTSQSIWMDLDPVA